MIGRLLAVALVLSLAHCAPSGWPRAAPLYAAASPPGAAWPLATAPPPVAPPRPARRHLSDQNVRAVLKGLMIAFISTALSMMATVGGLAIGGEANGTPLFAVVGTGATLTFGIWTTFAAFVISGH
jgi:hypothetical protein